MRRGDCQRLRMRPFACQLLLLFFVAASSFAAEESDTKAQQLAREVWKAGGGENWSRIAQLRFTFIVEEPGKQLIAAEHQWDLRANTDHVKWKDKEATADLSAPPADGDAKAAYARWVNDSYWLLAPLKILDPGVKLAYEGIKNEAGVACETLRLSFEQVGLTPGDQYVFYIDPQTKLLRAWDYVPNPATVIHSTWENYESFGGLQLATMHNVAGKVIRFADIKAVVAQ